MLPKDADKVADTLVQADLRGVNSHGAFQLLLYCRRLRDGGANPSPNLQIVRETDNTALLDGDDGLGQVVCIRAMEIAIDKAKGRGVAAVTACRSNHFGAAAYYSMMASEQDMIGYVTTNVPPRLPPIGRTTACYGNNPLAYAIPAGEEPTLVLDMALSMVARGKIRQAEEQGLKIPSNWARDKNGVPTDDPKKALEGFLLPIAGYKDYGLALVVEVLSSVMSGANVGQELGELSLDDTVTPRNIGHFCMALEIESFMPAEEFRNRTDAFIRFLIPHPLAVGFPLVPSPLGEG